MPKHKFGLIIPFYNYAPHLLDTLNKLAAWHESDGRNSLLVLVDDGSHDATGEMLFAFQKQYPEWCQVLRLPQNMGKGAAVRNAFLALAPRVEKIIFTDCDLHYGLDIIAARMLPELETNDIVIADRSWTGSRTHQAVSRRMSSYLFNRLMGLLTGVLFRDSQAGMKGFDVEACYPIFKLLKTNGFAFDVEILAIALFYRLRIAQVPVHFPKDYEFPTSSSIHLVFSSLKMFIDLVKINLRWKSGQYFSRELEERINHRIHVIK